VAVAIGNFDGVHCGHRALVARARDLGEHAVVLTFDPHPAALLGPTGAPAALTSLSRKIELLGEAGADAVVIEPFTLALAQLAPDAFIEQIVLRALSARAIVVGYDFTYGAKRAGTAEHLREHGARAGVPVEIVKPVDAGGEIASSTRIRALLATGDVAAAARLLGRPWDIDGVVVHGAKRGRAIGVPTANIAPASALPLRPGIYAVTLDGRPAVASLGRNPTFVSGGDAPLVLEVHVLDFDGDLYDRTVRTAFVGWLRDEAKFTGVEALVEQIRADIAAARLLLR
jgi:riboflavin kinase/FMN adenylyltransferase